ncbi:MAG: cytochrome c-type biogenesis CcmF C-terminal domain-containing protein [Acidimicrobiia bacterium]
MLAFLGSAGVVAALLGAALLTARGVRVARGGPGDLVTPVKLVLSGAIVAMGAMEIALLTDDFSIAYVANHHSTTTPFPFDVATAWAALEGSILLWGLILAIYTWVVLRRYVRQPDRLGAAALAVMGGVAIFFFGLMVTVANPFEVCTSALPLGCAASSPWPFAGVSAPLNGPGPNPLLQNHILMAIHPPMLYTGYVGLTVPFAYAMGALALAIPGPEWLRRSHRSTLVAWSFLTLGITLGGWWAYEVLSWGGYWAWDPVENASLMPWLVATAFLHSGLVQQRRGMLQAWNFILVISAFSLTILGTFLTRSGTINSVHSFTQSAIGPALLGFLVLVLVGSFALFSTRSHLVSSAPRIESFASREGLFLVNNLLLAVYGFIVLIGTTYPLLLEAFTGTQVGVGKPFFNRLAVPLSFLLLLTIGFGAVTPWRGSDANLVWRRLRWPALIALTAGTLTALTVTRVGWVILAAVLSTFVITTMVGLWIDQAAVRSHKSGQRLLPEMKRVLSNDQPFWAGQLSHVGVALAALGIAFAANLGAHTQVDLRPGESVDFAGYTLTYQSPFRRAEPNRTVQGARVEVRADDHLLGVLEPRANFYGPDSSGVVTPAVMTRPGGDLYLTLGALDSTTLTLGLDTSPMMWLLWFGGLTTAGGGFWAMSARRREKLSEGLRQTADV